MTNKKHRHQCFDLSCGNVFVVLRSRHGGFSLNLGDILCIVAAIAGSLHIIFVEKVAKNDNVDSTLFTVFLLAFISLWGTIIGFFIGDLNYTAATPEHLGVIFSLEPASGCILSVLLLKETMSWTAWLGSAIIMISIFYMEWANNKAAKE